MAGNIQAVRGMHDILPEHVRSWQFLEQNIRELLTAYGYQEIRMPLVEKTELFRRSIGEVTDIVEKEMYSFDDRHGESLTLRPEGTAGCVRAAIENGILRAPAQRLWYNGPMFRRERPQKGRYRQFHQIGVETFGLAGPDIDAEHIAMTARLWDRLGIGGLRLELNSLGSAAARAAYRDRLVAYFSAHESDLDEDSRRRLQSNPLRILDSKNPEMQALIGGAPLLTENLDDESREHFDRLQNHLQAAGVDYHLNPRLVRGLDYYSKTVYEWVTDRLGAQGTVCAGGRFDDLVEHLGGKATPATGFAIGMERMVAVLEESRVSLPEQSLHAYLVMVGETAQHHGIGLGERLRDSVPGLRMLSHCGGGGFKSQFKRADKSGASCALILGEDEMGSGRVGVKDLRDASEQLWLTEQELVEHLKGIVGADVQHRART